jgi:hypothetical protein
MSSFEALLPRRRKHATGLGLLRLRSIAASDCLTEHFHYMVKANYLALSLRCGTGIFVGRVF